jgi:hypothetical protein
MPVANQGRRRNARCESIFLRLSRRSHGRRQSTHLCQHRCERVEATALDDVLTASAMRGRVETADASGRPREKALGTREQGSPALRHCRRWGSRHSAFTGPRSADRPSEPGLAAQVPLARQ